MIGKTGLSLIKPHTPNMGIFKAEAFAYVAILLLVATPFLYVPLKLIAPCSVTENGLNQPFGIVLF